MVFSFLSPCNEMKPGCVIGQNKMRLPSLQTDGQRNRTPERNFSPEAPLFLPKNVCLYRAERGFVWDESTGSPTYARIDPANYGNGGCDGFSPYFPCRIHQSIASIDTLPAV